MRAILLLLSIPLFGGAKAHDPDSTLPKSKVLKNSVELGTSVIGCFDKYGMNASNITNFVSTYQTMYFKYARRLSKDFECGMAYYWYGRLYNIPDATSSKGQLNIRFFKNVTFYSRYSFLLFDQSMISIKPSVSVDLSYRFNGREDIFLTYLGLNEPVFDGTKYNSLGLGSSFDLDLIFKKRVYVGGGVSYSHYFQRPGLKVENPSSAFYRSYKPNRDVLAFHPKIGFLF